MYPISAVLVNCGDTRTFDVRSALREIAVRIVHEFGQAEDLLSNRPMQPDERRVIVIRVQGLRQTTETGKLNDAFPGWPIIAFVDGQVDASGLYALSRNGATQLLPFPPSSIDLSNAFDRLVVQFALKTSLAKIIVVTGAAPGSGTTTIAINLAAEISGLYEVSTALVELELVLGRLPALLDVSPPISVQDLLAQNDPPTLASVHAAMTKTTERLIVLTGPHLRVDPFQPLPGRVAHLLGILRRLTPVTVVDLPASYNPTFFEAITTANRVVLVGRQDVPTIQAMKLLRTDILGRGLPEPELILNNFDPKLEKFSPHKLGVLIGCPPLRTIAANRTSLRAAVDAGQTLSTVAPNCHALADIRELTGAILKGLGYPNANQVIKKKRSFLDWLMGS